jgi:hypothetical protein
MATNRMVNGLSGLSNLTLANNDSKPSSSTNLPTSTPKQAKPEANATNAGSYIFSQLTLKVCAGMFFFF